MRLRNQYVEYAIGADARNLRFRDRRRRVDYAQQQPPAPCALIRRAGKEHAATAGEARGGDITLRFGDTGVSAHVRAIAHQRYLVLEVVSVSGSDVEELTFANVPLTLKGARGEPFAACALALNLKTRVVEMPGPSPRLRATCYPRFGFAGARVALVACPPGRMRSIMQEVVSAAPDLPHSPIGGPWALDSRHNRGSYLFNFGNMSEENVDDWIRLARSLGINQIDFHGGNSFRFGDCLPNPITYPRGVASMKAVLDRLHAAGILAGLHTYACFIDKRCPWVTPVPDPRLGKDATFTLAEALDEKANTVPVVEPTTAMSTVTGFFVRNSVTLQIDDELIVYSGLSKEPPYAFTSCTRGAYGTRVAPHAPGARVHHLRECFGMFVPDGDSTLFTEVAARTAQLYNDAGFDMIYLDALDGGDTIAGPENSWHYESRFVFEIWRRLKRPAIQEMSTFHHHLWYVRSRLGAWDHPNRSHKKFIDLHVAANEALGSLFMPGHLGWWAFKTWSGPEGEPTFSDDIEYLMCKALATDTGFSIMGIDPSNVATTPALPRLAAITRQYEELRHAGYFTDRVKEKLRAPGEEFTLVQSPRGEWQFWPVQYARHKVEAVEDWSSTWRVSNRFGPQPVQLRIEALMGAGPYDAPGNPTLADSGDLQAFTDRAAAPGLTPLLAAPRLDDTRAAACYSASSEAAKREGAWCRLGRVFSPPLNLASHRALGLWVHGDGKGEVLNVQLTSPTNITYAVADHYVPVDFTGWRYVELVEPEGDRFANYRWPYGDAYSIYRESIYHPAVSNLSLYLNNVPPGESVALHLSPIRALPLVEGKWRNTSITIGSQTLRFPVEMTSGMYLEFRSPTDCKLYGPKGELIAEVKPEGAVPTLAAGTNEVRFACETEGGVRPRAYVTVISQGAPLRGARRTAKKAGAP